METQLQKLLRLATTSMRALPNVFTLSLASLLLMPGVILAQEFEAEDALLSPGFRVATNNSSFSGSGFVDYIGEGYVEWSVDVAESRTLSLAFRYALSSGDRPLDIVVNGEVISENTSFPATTSWNTWGLVRIAEVMLNRGTNTISAQTRGVSGPNMDLLILDMDTVHTVPAVPDAPCYDNQNRYVDCGNGTVTDTVTGLIWTKDAGCIPPQDYASANNVAAALEDGSCGLTDNSRPGDWHLPTQAEWAATIEEALRLDCTFQNNFPSLTDTTGTVCFNAGPQPFDNVDAAGTRLYWSSTAVPYDPRNAYEWNTNGNTTDYTRKVNFIQGWAIRGRHLCDRCWKPQDVEQRN